jgi:DNA-binding response OmpR family regulator
MLAGLDAVLQSWHCQTTLTRDRTSFLAAAKTAHDIVIADYQLDQDDNGIDVWLQLEEPRPPLVLISAVRDKAVIARVQELGGHYLAKPVRPLALRSVLHSVLQQREFSDRE